MSPISLELHRTGIKGGQLHGVCIIDSPLKKGNVGASKQSLNDLETKRLQVSVSTVRNVVRKCKATGKVSVEARSGRQRKISKRQRLRMVRMIKYNLQTTSKDL